LANILAYAALRAKLIVLYSHPQLPAHSIHCQEKSVRHLSPQEVNTKKYMLEKLAKLLFKLIYSSNIQDSFLQKLGVHMVNYVSKATPFLSHRKVYSFEFTTK